MGLQRVEKGWLEPITRKEAEQIVGSAERLVQLLASVNGQKMLANLATGAQLIRVFCGKTERFAVYGPNPLGDAAVKTTLGAIRAGKRGLVLAS